MTHRTDAALFCNLPSSASPKEVVIIAVHGRNQDETFMQDVLSRAGIAHLPTLYAIAPGKTWYPDKFMAPIENNEAGLKQSLLQVEELHRHLNELGFKNDQISFVGFSQGACLCSQYLLTHPSKYHSLFILTGGYVGQQDIQWNFEGDFQNTPVYITTSQIDEWVPPKRTTETAKQFEKLNAAVTLTIFEDRPHEICDAEIEMVKKIFN